jgi:hypothetical protein
MKTLIVLFILMFASPVFSQDYKDNTVTGSDGRVYRKKTEINFNADTIQGDLTRPDGEYIEARRSVRLSRLIQLRDNWKDRISQGVDEF